MSVICTCGNGFDGQWSTGVHGRTTFFLGGLVDEWGTVLAAGGAFFDATLAQPAAAGSWTGCCGAEIIR